MVPNHSPWIKQLNRVRPVTPLEEDIVADTVIVGGGIAGVMTAYFTLRDTERAVLLLDGDKVAHGATGHNAGQLATYFERSFSSIVEEFGLTLAGEGQRAVESAWTLLEDVRSEAVLATPVHLFTGYAGLSTYAQLIEVLEDTRLRIQAGLASERILVAREWLEQEGLPSQYDSLFEIAAHRDVLELLETSATHYIAVVASKKGCANSALLAEELVGYMLAHYPERFRLHEHTLVRSVTLHEDSATLLTDSQTITAARVVLATNGFETITIVNAYGQDIDTAFHHDVQGRIGYMTGYVELAAAPATAISYYGSSSSRTEDPTGEPYFYLTRRPFEHEGSDAWELICAGGPDKVLPNLAHYSRTHGCDEHLREEITEFLSTEYRAYPPQGTEHAFCWHGLMGYTPNRMRRVGYEPRNPILMYNLGCNGVGLLPSIMGGERISRLLRGEVLPPSVFDPLDPSTRSV